MTVFKVVLPFAVVLVAVLAGIDSVAVAQVVFKFALVNVAVSPCEDAAAVLYAVLEASLVLVAVDMPVSNLIVLDASGEGFGVPLTSFSLIMSPSL